MLPRNLLSSVPFLLNMGKGLVVVLVALSWSLIAAAVAHAGRVYVLPCDGCTDEGPQVKFIADPGEENAVVMRGDGREMTVADLSRPLRAESGCVALDQSTARCALTAGEASKSGYDLRLGDGNDRAETTVSSAPGVSSVSGDEGNDVVEIHGSSAGLYGGSGDDVLSGSSEGEFLYGDDGRDILRGNGGDDFLEDGGAGPEGDVYDGGAGRDRVQYATFESRLSVDLAAPSPSSGGGDLLTGVEDVNGGRGDDRLLGDDGPNDLSGGYGADVLEGRGGNDVLVGGDASSFLSGGPGDDRLSLRETGNQVAACGMGTDTVFGGANVNVAEDCEIVSNPGPTYPVSLSRPRLTGDWRKAVVAVTCPPKLATVGCRGLVRLLDKSRGKSIGARGFKVKGTNRARVAVPLLAVARDRLRSGGALTVVVRVTAYVLAEGPRSWLQRLGYTTRLGKQ